MSFLGSKVLADSRIVHVLAVQPELRWLQSMSNMHVLREIVERHVQSVPTDLVVLPEAFNGTPADYDPHAGPMARQFISTLR